MQLPDALKKIYIPPVGSIWRAPNRIWTTGFARNKSPEDFHPAIVMNINIDKISVHVIPGTSQSHNGPCIFRVHLKSKWKRSHFLLKMKMPYLIEDLMQLKRGWADILELNTEQLAQFQKQIQICKSIHSY